MSAAAHIRECRRTLEHFWIEAVKDRTDAEYLDAREIPASLVTDLATDPNGMVLQAANGRPAQIYVIVPVDGTLRIASGVVYNFYQFRQPLSARLTGEKMAPASSAGGCLRRRPAPLAAGLFSAALDRLAGGRLFLYGGGRPGAAQSAQKNAACSL